MRRRGPVTARFERRLLAAQIALALVAGLLVARIVQVQVVRAHVFREAARGQQQRTVPIPAIRGAIVDRDGQTLAFSLPPDPAGERPAARRYPRGRLAAHVVGATSADGRGLEGIEREFDRLLRGRAGSRVLGTDARGVRHTIPDGRVRPPVNGATLVLALDATVQSVLERELERCVEETGARSATGIVLDPRTGDVLAMASSPTYDPQEPGRFDPAWRRNRAIADLYEPGSTFKLVPAAAALEEGLADRHSLLESGKVLELAGGALLHDKEDRGWVSLEEAIVFSVNTATARLARRLGPERLYEYARAFGFGCVTGIELPGEVSGILRRPAHWSGRSLETIAIGQEVAVTPLQLACAYAAVANEGILLRPRVVLEVREESGKVLRRTPVRRVRRVVSPEAARTMREILTRVVEVGTGRAARVPGIPVAGKTGTAQRVDPRTGRYDPRRHVALFVGFLPADEPRLLAAVLVDRPAGAGWGGEAAAPCFRRVMEGILAARRGPVRIASAALAAGG